MKGADAAEGLEGAMLSPKQEDKGKMNREDIC